MPEQNGKQKGGVSLWDATYPEETCVLPTVIRSVQLTSEAPTVIWLLSPPRYPPTRSSSRTAADLRRPR